MPLLEITIAITRRSPFDIQKRYLFAHDEYFRFQDALHSLGGELATQFSWWVGYSSTWTSRLIEYYYTEFSFNSQRNYDHVSSLWQHEGWIPESAVDLARVHYGGYMVNRGDGLRVLALNADFCKSLL